MKEPSLRREPRLFAATLKRAMNGTGMSQTDVARDLGVRRATVRGWLSGSEPTDPNFHGLVAMFPEIGEFEDGKRV